MAQCVIDGINKYNMEIDKTLSAAKNYLSETQYEQFLNKQKEWEKSLKKI